MRKIVLIMSVMAAFISACHEPNVGYLETKDASYDPDTIYVRKTPDPVEDAVRIANKAPWISFALQGYEGTQPILFSVESVTSDLGEEAASKFMKDLSIRGGGALIYPFENEATPGTYKVSIRLTNPDYSQVIKDAMTIVVTE